LISTQNLHARVEADGLLLWLPDATLLHAGASFLAPSHIELCDLPVEQHVPSAASGEHDASPSSSSSSSPSSPAAPAPSSCSASGTCLASLVHVEWLHGGREARGELFDFEHYGTRMHVHHRSADGRTVTPILHEALTLERFQGEKEKASLDREVSSQTHLDRDTSLASTRAPTSIPQAGTSALARRLAPYVVFATVVLLGARVEPLARAIQNHVDQWHLRKQPRAGLHSARNKQAHEFSDLPLGLLVSCTWIDVLVTAPPLPPLPGEPRTPAAMAAASHPPSSSSSSRPSSSTHVRGCVLRLSGTSLEPVQAMLALYLAPLQPLIRVTPPWHA
jgi:hypothetical protein